MVGKKKPGGLRSEFEGGLLPGITGPGAPAGPAAPPAPVADRQAGSLASGHDGPPARKKVTLYLDDPAHVDLMDSLLTALRRYDLPRDNSMLVRALLNLAAPALTDQAHQEALAAACQQTLPHR